MTKEEMLILIIVIYVVGFSVSLLALHKFGRQLGWDHYDPPHGAYYDDYDSNAHAYLTFSVFWFIFWTFYGIAGIWRLMVMLSEAMGRMFKTKKDA